jgi:O-antigen/teichoic acid export membrane protein
MGTSSRRDLTGLVDQAIVSGGTLLTTVIFIRGAGMEEFGILSLVWLVLLFGQAVQHAAVIAPAYALLPKLEETEAHRFRGWLALVQLVFLALLLLALGASWVAPGFSLLPHSAGLFAALAFLAARLSFTFLRLQLFTAHAGPRRALFVDVVHVVATLGALGVLAWQERLDAHTGLFALAAASLFAALVALPRFLGLGCHLGLPGAALLRRHFELSKWLVGKALAQWFTANSFLAALGTLHGPAALGAVRAAQTLIGVAGIVIQGFENLIPAQAAAAFESGGTTRLREFLRATLSRWYAYLCLCLLPIVAFPSFFLQLLTGRTEQGLVEPLFFFAVGSLIALAILFLQVSLRAVERVGVMFWAQLASGLVGALAAVPVTLEFGLTGCLVGILTQQLIVFSLLLRPTLRSTESGTNPSLSQKVSSRCKCNSR